MNYQIDKKFALSIVKTLSAIESILLLRHENQPIAPDYLLDDLNNHVSELQEIILKGE